MRPRRFTRGWSPSYNYSPVREHGNKTVKEPKSKLEKELDTKKFVSKQCLKFGVENIFKMVKYLNSKKMQCKPIRVNEITGKRFTFFQDPDNLSLEIYEL